LEKFMENKSPTNPEEWERVVVIPSNYAEEGVIPICIRAIDDQGRRVHRGWIDAVFPIADALRTLARRVIGNIYQVSELADGSVHALSAKYGEQLGRSPSMQVYVHAKYLAKDLAVGGHRVRINREVELTRSMLEVLTYEPDFEKVYEDREFLERLKEQLLLQGKTDELKMLNLYLTGAEHKIAEAFGVKRNSKARNTLSQRFWRSIGQAADILRTKPTG
jgi:hypothetical protein